MAGRDARDRNSIDLPGLDAPVPDLAGVRLVASETLGFAPVDDDVLAAFREAVAAIEAAGATIVHDDPGLPSSVQIWATIAAADAWYEEGQEDEERAELLTAAAADFLAFGRTIEAGHYVHATFAREPVNRAYADLLARHRRRRAAHPDAGLRGVRARAPPPGADRRRRDRGALDRLGGLPVRRESGRPAGARAAGRARRRRSAGVDPADRRADVRRAAAGARPGGRGGDRDMRPAT